MQPHEYVALIKFALSHKGESPLSLHIEERVTARSVEDWTIVFQTKWIVSVSSQRKSFLKKLMKILKEADIKHELTVSNRLIIWGWTISEPCRPIVG